MFESIFSTTTLTLLNVVTCVVSAIVLGLVTAFTYMKTSRYSKNFVVTLCLLPLLVFVVMVMVNGSLGSSIAVLGAFSLIRFRSLPGTSKEIASIFLAMALGLSIGMGQIVFAIFITIISNLLMYLLYRFKFGEPKEQTRILKVLIPEDLDYQDIFNEIFEKYTTKCQFVGIKTVNMGSIYELSYEISMDHTKVKEFIDALRVRNGNLKISIEREMINPNEL